MPEVDPMIVEFLRRRYPTIAGGRAVPPFPEQPEPSITELLKPAEAPMLTQEGGISPDVLSYLRQKYAPPAPPAPPPVLTQEQMIEAEKPTLSAPMPAAAAAPPVPTGDSSKLAQQTLPGAPTLAGETAAEGAMMQQGIDRQANIDKLRRMLQISEGLRTATQGINVMGGVPAGAISTQDPMLRQQVAQAEDVVTPDEVKTLESALGVTIPPGMSRTQLNKILPTLSSAIGKKQAAARAEETRNIMMEEAEGRRKDVQARHEERMQRDIDKLVLKAGADFERNPRVKLHREQIDMADKALANLDLNNQQADKAAVIGVARASGEKGVLSDQDIARWMNRSDLLGRIATYANLILHGRLTEVHRGELRSIIEASKDVSRRAVESEGARMAKRYAAVFPQYNEQQVYENVIRPALADTIGTGEPSAATVVGNKVKLRDKQTGEMFEADSASWDSATAQEKAQFEVVP